MVDLFYKLKALQQQGISIHLHCFTNGRPPQDELNKYCVEVNYYQRIKNSSSVSWKLPLIVKSRASEELLQNLQRDNYPILLEGIHCSYFLYTGQLAGRKVILRLHNVEFEYYRHLAKHENNFFKRLYFVNESRLLKSYEHVIAGKATIVTVSKEDADLYEEQFSAKDIHQLPVFIPWTMAAGKEGTGTFCLYHGNLSVNENEKAAIWLLQNVFNDTDIAFVIAGKDPSKRLMRIANTNKNTCLIANPSETEMQDLISKAQVNVLPSFNNTGVKLKLLNALFNGRHCLVNPAAVAGSGLELACRIANEEEEFKEVLAHLYKESFTNDEIEKRQGLLQRQFNNEANAKQLITWLW